MSYYADKMYEIPQSCIEIDSFLKTLADLENDVEDALETRHLPHGISVLFRSLEIIAEDIRTLNGDLRDPSYQNGLVADNYANIIDRYEDDIYNKEQDIDDLKSEIDDLRSGIRNLEIKALNQEAACCNY